MDVEIQSGGRTVSIHEKKVVLNPPIDPTVFGANAPPPPPH
jgi:hypothetical protein